MISLSSDTRILIATTPADFRKGIDGFVAICKMELAQNPRSGTLFVFINRSKTMIRVLTYKGNGFWLITKRLSKGKYNQWPVNCANTLHYDAKTLRNLLNSALSNSDLSLSRKI